MTVTFDEEWNEEDDSYAVILSPSDPSRAYSDRAVTVNDLLDLRLSLTYEISATDDSEPESTLGAAFDAGRIDGLTKATQLLDTLIAIL